jgi:hypothetical protein
MGSGNGALVYLLMVQLAMLSVAENSLHRAEWGINGIVMGMKRNSAAVFYWRYYLLEVLLIGSTNYWRYYLLEVLLIGGTTYWRYYLLEVLPIGGTTPATALRTSARSASFRQGISTQYLPNVKQKCFLLDHAVR